MHLFFLMLRPPPSPTLFPYTTLFRSHRQPDGQHSRCEGQPGRRAGRVGQRRPRGGDGGEHRSARSEEHTSELQSPYDLVCRLLLEKKKKQTYSTDKKRTTTTRTPSAR